MSRDAMSQLDIELKIFHLGILTTQAAKTCESDQVKLLLELKADATLKDSRVFEPRNWEIEKTSSRMISRQHMMYCRPNSGTLTVGPLSLVLLVFVSNLQDTYGYTALKLANAYKTKTVACREHPSAHETTVKLLSSDEPVADQM